MTVLSFLTDFRHGLSDRVRTFKPSFKMFSAAFSSRRINSPQAQTQTRSPRFRALLTTPQVACKRLEGNHLSIFCVVLPRHRDLYSS